MYQEQLEIEAKYSKANIATWVQSEVESDSTLYKAIVRAITRYQAQTPKLMVKRLRLINVKKHTPEDIAIDLIHTVLSITDEVSSLQGVATALGSNYHTDQITSARTGLDILGACADTGLYDIIIGSRDTGTSVVVPNYQLSQDTLDKIHNTLYLPPMLTTPRPWTDNSTGGLLTQQSSCILGNGNHHKGKQSLDVLNILQDIPWKLNLEGLDKQETKRTALTDDPDEVRKTTQHNARCAQSEQVYNLMLEQGNHFYFTWKYDKRGRSYSQGYDINLQASEYKKAILEFANEEILEGI